MYFNKIINVRINDKIIKDINKIVRKKNEKYENASHFIRCAILRTIREEK